MDAQSEIFNFEWNINTDVDSMITSKTFNSTLDGGLSFQIVVKRSESYKNQMCIGLRKVDEKKCEIRALLLFEIRDYYTGQLYLKESLEKLYCLSKKEHFSEPFDTRKREGRILYNIKGEIFFQCCHEKESSESLCKNISQLQTDLKDLLQNEVYADVKFHIGDAVILAHKNILCSRSAVFKKMFEQNMKEKEASTVKIIDIEMSVFKVFLIFLYTGSIEGKQLNIIMPLYSVADKYAVETLLKTCSKILANYISVATVAPILKLADMHNDNTLKATAIEFLCKNFAKIEATESWDSLLNSDPRLASYALKQVSITAANNLH